MNSIRETIKRKFSQWIDARCDKGEATYGHSLDDCPDDDFDWRDMLIEELLDGMQYQEKEIKRLQKLVSKKNLTIQSLLLLEKKAPYMDIDD